MIYDRYDVIAWSLILLGAGILETMGLLRRSDATLTALIRLVIPVWGRAMILGWLCWHFLIQKGN